MDIQNLLNPRPSLTVLFQAPVATVAPSEPSKTSTNQALTRDLRMQVRTLKEIEFTHQKNN